MRGRAAAACMLAAACASSPGVDAVLAPTNHERSGAQRDEDVPVPPNISAARPGVSLVHIPTGDAPVTVSVEEAVVLALANNRDLAVQQLNPVVAGTFESIERGAFDPELFGQGTYSRERSSEVARSTGERFDVDGRASDVTLGLRQQLPTGTTVEGTVSHRVNTSNRTPDQQTARLGVGLTQALLRGFGPAVNLARVRQAHLETVGSTLQLRGYTEALIAEVENAYWAYVLATQQLDIFRSSLKLANQQREEVEQRIEVGATAPTEAAAARAEVARREQDLIDARSAWEARRLTLARSIGLRPGVSTGRMIRASSPAETPETVVGSVSDHVQTAAIWRPDLGEARIRLEQGRLDTVVTRNGVLPRLDLFVALGKTGFAASFRDSFGNLDANTFDLTAGLSLSHFLGRRAASAQDLAARATAQQARRAVENLAQLVELDVRLALNELERARQQIEASKATRRLREEAANAERERYGVGSSTTLLVAQAQRDLLQSQIAEVEAVVAYRRALTSLFVAEGTLLARRGIEMDGAYPGELP